MHQWGSPVALMVEHLPAMQGTWVRCLGWEDPLEKGMATRSVLLPGESHGQRSLVSCSPQGHKEVDTAEWLSAAQRIWLFQKAIYKPCSVARKTVLFSLMFSLFLTSQLGKTIQWLGFLRRWQVISLDAEFINETSACIWSRWHLVTHFSTIPNLLRLTYKIRWIACPLFPWFSWNLVLSSCPPIKLNNCMTYPRQNPYV